MRSVLSEISSIISQPKATAPGIEPSALLYEAQCANIASAIAVSTSCMAWFIPSGRFNSLKLCKEIMKVGASHSDGPQHDNTPISMRRSSLILNTALLHSGNRYNLLQKGLQFSSSLRLTFFQNLGNRPVLTSLPLNKSLYFNNKRARSCCCAQLRWISCSATSSGDEILYLDSLIKVGVGFTANILDSGLYLGLYGVSMWKQ